MCGNGGMFLPETFIAASALELCFESPDGSFEDGIFPGPDACPQIDPVPSKNTAASIKCGSCLKHGIILLSSTSWRCSNDRQGVEDQSLTP